MMLFLTRTFFFFLPFQLAFPFFGDDIPFFRAVAPLFLLYWLVQGFITQEKMFPPLLLNVCLLSWLIVTTVSAFLSADPWLSVRKIVFLFNIYPLVLVWYAVMKSSAEREQVVTAALWGGAAAAFLGIGIFISQFFVGVGPAFHFLIDSVLPFSLGERLSQLVASYPSLLVNIGGATWLRLTALFPDPHGAAYFFGILSCLAFGIYVASQSKRYLFLGLVLLLADLLTFSRGGYIGLVVAGLVFFAFVWQKKERPTRWLTVMIGIIPLLVFLGLPILQRFISTFALTDASSLDRLMLWQQAFETWLRFPWFGLGIGQYAEWVYPGIGQSIPYYAHNLYLDLAVETGIVGLFFSLFLCGVSIVLAVKHIRCNEPFFWGVLAGWLLYLAHSLFETALFSLPVALLCTLLLALSFTPTPSQTEYPVQ